MENTYLRCEIWEDTEAAEWDELFFIYDGDYGRHFLDCGVTDIIKNPLNKEDTKRLFIHASLLTEDDIKNGYLAKTIKLSDGRILDIIKKEGGVFPYTYKEWYDNNNYFHRKIKTNFIEEINNVIYKLFK